MTALFVSPNLSLSIRVNSLVNGELDQRMTRSLCDAVSVKVGETADRMRFVSFKRLLLAALAGRTVCRMNSSVRLQTQ
jgi:hypothetical protein